MPAIMIERQKLTRPMYQSLKRHIMKDRERKKQEQAQDEELEKQRKEQELRKKKEAEDSLTLEQTKEQIGQLEQKLESMRQEKHGLFSQLKKVLHQEDESRKRAQEKEHNEMVASMQQQQQQQAQFAAGLAAGGGGGSSAPQPHMYLTTPVNKYLNVNQIHQRAAMYAHGQKRTRSPSPPHTSVYSNYPPGKYQGNPVAHAGVPKKAYVSGKVSSYQPPPSTHASYVSQAGYAMYHAAAAANAAGNSGNYPTAHSAFHPHYAHQQLKEAASQQAQHSYPSTQQFPLSRLPHQAAPTPPQPRGYLPSGHGGSMPLQQQIEHANKKSGFAEDKYKLQMFPSHQTHNAPPPGGSISNGYRTQPSSTAAYPPQPTQSVASSSQHHHYPQQRYYR